MFFFFSSRRRHTRSLRDWSSDVCSSDLAVAKENQPLIDALNSGLDAVIADGTWARLYSDWVPRALPPGWKPGSKAAAPPELPHFAAIAAANQPTGPAPAPAAPT